MLKKLEGVSDETRPFRILLTVTEEEIRFRRVPWQAAGPEFKKPEPSSEDPRQKDISEIVEDFPPKGTSKSEPSGQVESPLVENHGEASHSECGGNGKAEVQDGTAKLLLSGNGTTRVTKGKKHAKLPGKSA